VTSTQAEIDQSYSVSNEFFQLWLDENLHYTSAVFDAKHTTLEAAQENKLRRLYEYAEVTPDKRVLDIGCGWGSAIDCVTRFGCKEAVGITLSTEQLAYCKERRIPNATFLLQDYATYEPAEKFDALISIEMIDHLCSPQQQKEGLAVDIYRGYFNKLAQWVKPGDCFGFQAILRNRIPRNREHLRDLQFTADVIFPGGLNPRIEELVAAISPRWELIELQMMREDYGKTTFEWRRRFRLHEAKIRATWGDQVYDDYERYLSACVRQFELHYSGDVQMKLRRID
jgi:cyclopropane-fatty-acyl-phospholipid synthase